MSATLSMDSPAAAPVPAPASMAPLQGGMLIGAALLLAGANFLAVLDTSIANVSVSTIAGNLGATNSQATYVITSYAVAEAITVPLTGWLAARFGAVRVFVMAMLLFGLFSALCGVSQSLGMLVVCRVLQGLAGGPLMPLSQTLLLRIFPKDKAPAAMGLWAMTTLVAPVLGPILGGAICDNLHWSYIFYINVPIAALCGVISWKMLKRYELPSIKDSIDGVGLSLLVVWVAALQLMLDEGKDLDWFSSNEIIALAVIAAIGFASFLIWELTERKPIVDLRVFRHRGFSASVLTICLAFGAFFGATVLTPLWLQGTMGYSATQAGYLTALSGVLAVVAAPLAAGLSTRFDGRLLVFIGVIWMGLVTLYRGAVGNLGMDGWAIGLPLLLMGPGLPFFFVPLTSLALSSVDEPETASAAGLMSFCRTISGAFATSLVNTEWENQTQVMRANLVGITDPDGSMLASLRHMGMGAAQAVGNLQQMVASQAVMLATNRLFLISGAAFVLAALAIWLAPRPARVADTSQAH